MAYDGVDPEDHDLLNAIFRGFHTVKGGAGFLSLTNLVEVCHAAEHIFDCLRNGKLSINPVLMDIVLRAYDCIKDMFDHVTKREDFDPAPSDLMAELKQLASGTMPAAAAPKKEPEPKVEEKPAPKQVVIPAGNPDDIITDDEFEDLLDQLHGKGHAPGSDEDQHNQLVTSDVTDAEFEKLLDGVAGSQDKKEDNPAETKPQPSV